MVLLHTLHRLEPQEHDDPECNEVHQMQENQVK